MTEPIALLGGTPVASAACPRWPPWPRMANLDTALGAAREVLESTCWTARSSAQSTRLPALEARWAERLGTRHALLVSSGSAALELALRALEIGPGDEVLVPALGWYATAAAVTRVGARAVFYDVDPATSCADPAAAERQVSDSSRAIIAVHLHAGLADLKAFRKLADRLALPLIEDAAQAHGAAFGDVAAGSWGDLGCFSFNQEKTLPLGEGGAIVTQDEALYRRLYGLRTDGYRPATNTPGAELQAANFCLSELQAALLPGQLDAFEGQDALRRSTAAQLESALESISGVRCLETAVGTTLRPYYEFGLRFEQSTVWGDWPLDLLGRALSAELGFELHRTDPPVPAAPQFDPSGRRRGETPAAAALLYDRLLVFHHRFLLEPRLADLLPRALQRIQRASQQIPADRLAGNIAHAGR